MALSVFTLTRSSNFFSLWKQPAKDVIGKFGSLKTVLEADLKALKGIKDIGDNNVFGLKITQDVARRYLADRIVDLDYIAKVYLIRINCILFFRESRQ